MRRQQRRLNGECCWESDTEDDDEDDSVEFLPPDEAAKKIAHPMSAVHQVKEVCVVQYFVDTVDVLKTCLKKMVDPSPDPYKTRAADTFCEMNGNGAKDSLEKSMNPTESQCETDMNPTEGQCETDLKPTEGQCDTDLKNTEDPCERNSNSNAYCSFEVNMNESEDLNRTTVEHIIDPSVTNNGCSGCAKKSVTEQPIGKPSVHVSNLSCQCPSQEKLWNGSGCFNKLMCICGPKRNKNKNTFQHAAFCEQSVVS